ncbi:hypothetical protein IAD21_03687 [Abditibacteriota bacterium]|nr:hypothetical protein IAD21_03687 [Abditibacteriota bacterium]
MLQLLFFFVFIMAESLLALLIETRFVRQFQKKIFSAVLNRKLKPDSSGAILLPKMLRFASRDGQAYITKQDTLTMVFFPSWSGKGSNIRGTLICSRALTPEDLLTERPCYEPPQAIEINYPHLLSFYGPYGIGLNVVFIEKKLSGNSYSVFNDLS